MAVRCSRHRTADVDGSQMALKYRGHTFDVMPTCTCCVGDAQAVLSDPTGTGPIRVKWAGTARIKWQQLRALTREMLVTNDLLQLKAMGLLALTNPAIIGGGSKITSFQAWFDLALEKVVLESTGTWMRQYVDRAYAAGQAFGQQVVGVGLVNLNAQHRTDTIAQLATIELQGVMEAVSQQAVRAVANGIINGQKPLDIVRAIYAIIDKVGVTRTRTMIELVTVKAYNEAVLDVYEATGVTDVGLVVEARIDRIKMGDAAKKRVKRRPPPKSQRKPIPSRATGPGSRSRGNTPSGRTIQRIERVERELEKMRKVNVRTAGDDDVCPICEAIAKNGPYKINTARALIPAHPNCRCTFIPADDKRFKPDEFDDEEDDVSASVARKPRATKAAGRKSDVGGGSSKAKAKPPAKKAVKKAAKKKAAKKRSKK